MDDQDPAQLADLLHGLTRRLRRAQAERLAPLGLTPAQERALRLIADGDEPPRMTELADRLRIVPRSLTTVIDALEAAGLVRREVDPSNRRAILLSLTERGAAFREQQREARRRAAEDLFAPLPPADRAALGQLLARLDSAADVRYKDLEEAAGRPSAHLAGTAAAAGEPGAGRRLRRQGQSPLALLPGEARGHDI
jgi:DNA-binding MarR family transcriptional regulator